MENTVKIKALEYTKDFLLALVAGVCISVGCMAYLASNNKIVGSLFFIIGLFSILVFNLNLYTGKIGTALDHKPSFIANLAVIWLGNLVGAVVAGYVMQLTRLTSLQEACITLANTKINDSPISVFVLGIFCNMLIFLATYGWAKFENYIVKTLALFFGVSVFVICGFEHCVADMFYFTFANAWCGKTIVCLLIITLGNTVGGLLPPATMKLCHYLNNKRKSLEDKK